MLGSTNAIGSSPNSKAHANACWLFGVRRHNIFPGTVSSLKSEIVITATQICRDRML